MNPRREDPVIDEIRQVRHEISARFDHDVTKYVQWLMERQIQHADRLMDQPKNDQQTDQHAA